MGESLDDGQEYEFRVVEIANPSVTKTTTYSVDGGPSFPVEDRGVRYLVADSNHNNGKDFLFLAVDEKLGRVHGVSRAKGQPIKNIVQGRSGIVKVSEAEDFDPQPWSCDVEHEDEFMMSGNAQHIDSENVFGHRKLEKESGRLHEHHHHHQHPEHDEHIHLHNPTEDMLNSLLGSVKNAPRRKLYATDNFPALYSYVVEMYIEIDNEFVQRIGNGVLANAHEYVNALISAVSTVYEREVDTHLSVVHIAQTSLYDSLTTTTEALSKMRQTYGGSDWHYKEKEIDLHHALLGNFNGGVAYIGQVCSSSMGFGLSGGLYGNFESLGAPLVWDLIIVGELSFSIRSDCMKGQ